MKIYHKLCTVHRHTPTHTHWHVLHTDTQSLGAERIYMLSGVICVAVLLALILVLCVCIFCILCYHYKNKESRLGQILRGNSHTEPLYDNPDDPRYVLSPVSAPHTGTHANHNTDTDPSTSANPSL